MEWKWLSQLYRYFYGLLSFWLTTASSMSANVVQIGAKKASRANAFAFIGCCGIFPWSQFKLRHFRLSAAFCGFIEWIVRLRRLLHSFFAIFSTLCKFIVLRVRKCQEWNGVALKGVAGGLKSVPAPASVLITLQAQLATLMNRTLCSESLAKRNSRRKWVTVVVTWIMTI